MFRKWLICVAVLVSPLLADVTSGPEVGKPIEGFSVEVVTGSSSGQKVDVTAARATKPTVYAFVPSDKWSRPCARFLKKLDGAIGSVQDAQVVAIWLSSDVNASKDYLPKAQQSLQFNHTDLSVFAGLPSGPSSWGINTDADVTIVVVKEGKVAATFGFVSVNETVVDQVIAAVK